MLFRVSLDYKASKVIVVLMDYLVVQVNVSIFNMYKHNYFKKTNESLLSGSGWNERRSW